MNIDELIKSAYEEEALSLNISNNKHDEMLKYIEEQANLEKDPFSLIIKIRRIISDIRFKEFIAVTAFIFILVAIPIAGNAYKNAPKSNTPKYQAKVNESVGFQGSGPGIILYLKPGNSKDYLSVKNLNYIINSLVQYSAKAISINHYPITNQSTIKVGPETDRLAIDKYHLISLSDIVVIEAIGDKTQLYTKLSTPGVLNNLIVNSDYAITLEKQDLIKIPTLYKQEYKIDESKILTNDSSLEYDKAIKNGDVVMISGKDNKVYNIDKLDNFIESFKEGKESKIRIITYGQDGTKTFINKLSDLEYDGCQLILTGYDPYSVKNKLIPSEPTYFAKIAKSEPKDGIRYSLCTNPTDPDTMGMTLISFLKNDISDTPFLDATALKSLGIAIKDGPLGACKISKQDAINVANNSRSLSNAAKDMHAQYNLITTDTVTINAISKDVVNADPILKSKQKIEDIPAWIICYEGVSATVKGGIGYTSTPKENRFTIIVVDAISGKVIFEASSSGM